MLFRTRILAALTLVIALAALGCSGGGDGGGSFVTINGIVKHNGNAVDDAKVLFVSTTEVNGAKVQFSSYTGSDGKYEVGGNEKSGISPGTYKVVILKLVGKTGGKVKLPEDFDPVQLELSGLGKNVLPKAYSDAKTTKLSATIKPGANDGIDFNLEGK